MATLLCADDSPTIQKVVELTFADSGIRVVCASDGEAAIRRCREIRPDLLLLDVAMPARDGYEVCEWVRREVAAPQPKVLLLSSALDPFDPRRAEACGADGHMAKPFESSALFKRVQAMLGIEPAPVPAGAPAVTDAGGIPSGELFDPDGFGPQGPDDLLQAAEEITSFVPLPRQEPARGRTAVPGGEAPAPRPPAMGRPASAAGAGGTTLSPADVDTIARRLVELIGPEILREIAWEIIPDLADTIVREKLAQAMAPARDRSR